MIKRKKLIVGCVNPPGEAREDRAGTFRTHKELEELERGGAIGLPVYIEHMTEIDGKKVEPSGVVLSAKIGKKSKKLYFLMELYDNVNGKLAEEFLSKQASPQLSLGGTVLTKTVYDEKLKVKLPVPVSRLTSEVSLVYKGDREGTDIIEYTTEEDFLKR